jgi:hypothetical protein
MTPKLKPKPLHGVMPKQIWVEKRACDLLRAMHEYSLIGDWEKVFEWQKELENLFFIMWEKKR